MSEFRVVEATGQPYPPHAQPCRTLRAAMRRRDFYEQLTVASSEPRPENPYRTVHARMSPPGAAWDEGFAAGRAAEPEPHESERIAEWAAREAEPNPYRSQDQIVRDEERQRILAQLDSVEAEEAVVNALMAAVEAGADLGSEARAAITALVGLVERGGTNA